MKTERNRTSWLHRFATLLLVLIGVGSIVGSGGGIPDMNSNFSGPFAPFVSVAPLRQTVQVGDSATFTASVGGTGPFTFQWRRDGVDIAGATGRTYSLNSVSPGDDGSRYSVVVRNSVGADTSPAALLYVSAQRGLTYQDADFVDSDWTAAAVTDPPQNGPTHVSAQAPTAGFPDAFRRIVYEVPTGPASIRVFHASLAATYDPAQQGALYTIDYALDCNRVDTTTLSETEAMLVIEQGGRWFAPTAQRGLCGPYWGRLEGGSLIDADLELVGGPPCGAGESCPDFSVTAAPMRFGFATGVRLPPEAGAGTVTQGIDNWKATIWRR